MVKMTNSDHGKRKVERVNRFVVMLTDAELQAIKDHKFAHRIGSSSETVRQLIKKSLEEEMPVPTGE